MTCTPCIWWPSCGAHIEGGCGDWCYAAEFEEGEEGEDLGQDAPPDDAEGD